MALWIASIALAASLRPTPARAWQVTVQGTDPDDAFFDQGRAVVMDGAGNVFAAGTLTNGSPGSGHSALAVVKLAAADGMEQWRTSLEGTGFGGAVAGVALDSSGDVLVAGSLRGTTFDIVVAKLSKTTGDVLWQETIDGSASGDDFAGGIAVNTVGDVVVAGQVVATGPVANFFVAKLANGNGNELWRKEIHDSGNATSLRNSAAAAAFDHNGDVVAVGAIDATDLDIYAIKLNGTTGMESWHQQLDGNTHDIATAVAVDGTGNAIVVGAVRGTPIVTLPELFTAKLDATDGHVLWGGLSDTFSQAGVANAVAVDGNGDVVVAGEFVHPAVTLEHPAGFGVVKRAAATGAVLWLQEPFGAGTGQAAEAVTIDQDDNVVAAGLASSKKGTLFAVAKLSGNVGNPIWTRGLIGGDAIAVATDAANDVAVVGDRFDFFFATRVGPPALGKSIVVQDKATDPTKRKIQVQVKDKEFFASGPGSTGDPTLAGATLEITNPTSHETVTLALPAMNWKGSGKPAGAKGYKYADKKPFEGPCTAASLKSGQWKVACKGDQIGFTLDEPSQGSLAATLTMGTESSCLLFGGTIKKDIPTVGKTTGAFQAKDAPAPAGCF
ncbi:MAG TPA: hypothetical protein VGK30_17385 [Candidatus Binatia bacterium]